ARFFDLVRLALQEILGALLDFANLLDAETRPDRQPIRIFSRDVVDRLVSRFFEQLQRAQAHAANEAQLLALGEGLTALRRLFDARVAQALHRAFGSSLQRLRFFFGAHAVELDQLFRSGFGDFFEGAEAQAIHG